MNKKEFSPSTHIFLWDLHDVILKKSLWNWFMICLRFNQKKELIRRLNRKTIKIMAIFFLERLRITQKQMVSEELITAALQSNNHALIALTAEICSSYVPIKNTVALIHELSALGYKHHLGSNIGKTIFEDCANKFPTLFKKFEACSIPFNASPSKLIKKPNTLFFTSHATKYNLTIENIIFIDDKQVNVAAAQSVGMQAIHFRNAKQLRNQLIQWKIITDAR